MFVPKKYRRNLLHLISGHVVSTFGSSLYLLGVTLYLKELTNSGLVLGLYHFLALLPPVLLGPIGGAVVDALSRARVLVFTDLVRGGLMVLLSLVILLRPQAVGAILVVTLLGGCSQALFLPAARAILAEILPPNHLRRANALRTGVVQLANLGGNVLGGVAYLLLGMPLLLLVNGLSFVASAIEETRIGPTSPPNPSAEQRDNAVQTDDRPAPRRRLQLGALLADSRAGFSLVWLNPGLRTLALAGSVVQFIAPPLVLSLPFVVVDTLGLPESFLGYFFATTIHASSPSAAPSFALRGPSRSSDATPNEASTFSISKSGAYGPWPFRRSHAR